MWICGIKEGSEGAQVLVIFGHHLKNGRLKVGHEKMGDPTMTVGVTRFQQGHEGFKSARSQGVQNPTLGP